jgi:hypothetical protein
LERFCVSVCEPEFSVFNLSEYGVTSKVAIIIDGADRSWDDFYSCLKHLPLEFAEVVGLFDVNLDWDGEGLCSVGVFDPESEPNNV